MPLRLFVLALFALQASVASAATLGLTTVGNLSSSGPNMLAASRATTSSQGGTMTSMSVYVTAAAASPNNLCQLAIYSDSGGVPGSLIAAGAPRTVTGHAWNTVPISATLAANTTYWLAVETNGASALNYQYSGAGATFVRTQPFGTMPAAFGPSTSNPNRVSIYGTYTPAADVTPPTVSLTAPLNSATISGAVSVTASASDNIGVSGVQFLLDGVNVGLEDTGSPYSISWNTTGTTSGPHVLSARARDAAGNSAVSASVNVLVDNQAPTGSILINAGATATNNRNVTLTLAASDTLSPVTQMRFSNTASGYSTPESFAATKVWTLSAGSGTKTVYVQYRDALGNWSAGFTDTIALDSSAPTISAVAATAITTNSVAITWSTDESATSLVEYGTTTSYGFSSLPDSSLVSSHAVNLNGLNPSTTYSYRVRSTDSAGNERIGLNNIFTTTAAPDTAPPLISAVVANASDVSATISWTTDELADTKVNYGLTPSYGLSSPVNPSLVKTHSVTLAGLSPNTIYHYQVVSKDASGNTSVSGAFVFTTLAGQIHLGIMGDSASDEYRADDNRGGTYSATTLNWLELLVRYRNIDAGPWGSRSDSRRTGYEYNWALSGATAADMIAQGQHTGLAAQVAAGKVNTVVLYIGANDFASWNGTYAEIYNGTLSGAALQQKISNIVSSISTAINTVQASGVIKMIVVNYADRGTSPVFMAQFPDASKRQLVTNAILAVNAGIQSFVNSRANVALFDLYNLGTVILAQVDAGGNLIVGGQQISLVVDGDEPHHVLIGDHEHIGTVMGGVMANNLFVSTYDRAFGGTVALFSDQEMLANGGIH